MMSELNYTYLKQKVYFNKIFFLFSVHYKTIIIITRNISIVKKIFNNVSNNKLSDEAKT